MFVKCSYFFNSLIKLPENSYYEFKSEFDDGLYLILSNKEILLRDIDYWCQGRTELPSYAVYDLYSEIVDVIANLLTNDENIKIIDIDEIETDLINKNYEKAWLSRGYITISEDGSW